MSSEKLEETDRINIDSINTMLNTSNNISGQNETAFDNAYFFNLFSNLDKQKMYDPELIDNLLSVKNNFNV